MIYTVIWSLDRWGLFDWGMDDELIFLEWIRWPIQFLEKFVAQKQEEDVFTPGDKAQIYLFTFLLFPILYILTSELSLYNIFFIPWLALVFLIDKRLFLEPELGKIFGRDMPRAGLPAAWSEYYELFSLMWGETTYLFGKNVAGIHIWQFIFVEMFSVFQLTFAMFMDPIMIIWAAVSTWCLVSVLLYEYFILGVTFEDIEAE
jgi:hypothetical protein